MALVERLMKIDPDSDRFIPVHDFFAACHEINQGNLTVAQVKTFLAMDASDETDFDALIALSPGSAAGKALFVESIHSVFILAESRYPGYDTPANVRTKLGI